MRSSDGIGCVGLVGLAVGQDHQVRAVVDRGTDLGTHLVERRAQSGTALGHRVEAVDVDAAETGQRVVGVDLHQLGESVVVENRRRQLDLPARLGAGIQQVGLGADGAADAGDDLLADRVERRVGHLGEQLLEVVEQHARALGEHRDRGVGAHRAECLGTGLGHRRDQEVEFFTGVTEDLLPQRDSVMRHVLVRRCLDVVDRDQSLLEPLPVGMLGGELVLDLLVVDDAAGRGVHEEHAARLQTHLLHDVGVVDVEHADLGGHDDQSVLGDPDTAGAQAVPVEHGAHDGAVGEADRRRPVPRLHQRGVVAVERPMLGLHRLVTLPCLGNHHENGVREAASAEVEQLEHLVEARGVRRTGGADREDLRRRVGPEGLGVDERLAGPHPVLVAGDGVDLAVVGDAAERMRQRPRREGVGGEARMHQTERALDARVLQVDVELPQLRGRQHALVDEGASGQAGEVHGLAARAVGACTLVAELVLHALAHDVGATLELHALCPADEHLAEGRHGVAGERSERALVGGHLAPSEQGQALGLDDLLHALTGEARVLRALGQEGDTGRVAALGGQLEVHGLPQEAVRDLDHDPGTVTGVRLGARGAAVLEIHQRHDRLVDDVATAPPMHVHDERHAARVVLVAWVVETHRSRSLLHSSPHFAHEGCTHYPSSMSGATPGRVGPRTTMSPASSSSTRIGADLGRADDHSGGESRSAPLLTVPSGRIVGARTTLLIAATARSTPERPRAAV